MTNQLKSYEYFITVVTEEIAKMFEYQKEYICCQNGCSGCCEQGMYPFAKLEFDYLKQGYDALSPAIKEKVNVNIKVLKSEYKGEHFMYKCPMLIDGSCAVYKHRGIICRTFGLITENSEGKLTVPYCAGEGLNYSKVYDVDKKQIFEEKVKELGYKVLPKAYNLSRKNLMNLSLANSLNLEFGESKMLLEWFIDILE